MGIFYQTGSTNTSLNARTTPPAQHNTTSRILKIQGQTTPNPRWCKPTTGKPGTPMGIKFRKKSIMILQNKNVNLMLKNIGQYNTWHILVLVTQSDLPFVRHDLKFPFLNLYVFVDSRLHTAAFAHSYAMIRTLDTY